MKVTKIEGKCGTCGLGIRKGEDHSKVGRTMFHASYVECSEAQRREDVQRAVAHREAFVSAALSVARNLDNEW